MATTTTSDPYKVLGVATDADAAAIKKAYRKLVLSCHPDKVTDESLKAAKQEEFHQIQQAYETIGDPDNRNKYELELRAKKQKEERDRAAAKAGSSAQYRNVNIYTAQHPSEYRGGSSSKHSSPTKPASYKPYSAEFSKSWDHNVGNRSGAFEAERKTRRTYSDERLNDDSRERRRKDEERERRRRQEDAEAEEKRAKHARRMERDREELERKEFDRRERARAKEAAAAAAAARRKEDERIREKAERRARERAASERELKLEAKRRAEEEKLEEEERRSRSKKSSKKDSTRDKTPSKPRDRTSPRDEVVPDLPTAEDSTAAKTHSTLAFAAGYIQSKKTSSKSTTPSSSSKYPPADAARAPYSDAYPDPANWVPKRRVSGEKPSKMSTDLPTGATSAPTSPSGATGPPPRLQKSHTMGHVPSSSADAAGRPTLNRAQTFDAEAFMRSSMSGDRDFPSSSPTEQRPRLSRQRTAAVDEHDFYATPPPMPRVQKYSIGREKGVPRTFAEARYSDPYAPSMPAHHGGGGATFPRVKTSQAYGPEHLASTKTRFDHADVNFASYVPQQQTYVA